MSDNVGPVTSFVENDKFCADLEIKIRSGSPLLQVVTPDVEAAVANIRQTCVRIDREVIFWTMSHGFAVPDEQVFSSTVDLKDELVRVTTQMKCQNSDPSLKQHSHVFEAISLMTIRKPNIDGKMVADARRCSALFVLVDFDLFAGMLPDYGCLLNMIVNNSDLTGEIVGCDESFSKSILFLSATSTPKELTRLKDFVRLVEFGLPTVEEARQIVDFCVDNARTVIIGGENGTETDKVEVVKSKLAEADDQIRNAIAMACNGLNRQQIVDVVAEAMPVAGSDPQCLLDIVRADQEERMAGNKAGYDKIPGVRVLDRCLRTSVNDLQGSEMDELGAIVRRHLRAFTPEGLKYKLPRRAGCIIAGPPGTGKTDFARAIGGIAKEVCGDHFPVIDWEFDALFGGIVGDSERNSRNFWERIREISPCVVILDEAEKMFSGLVSGYSGDGGIGMRLFRQMISNIEDGKRRPVSPYIVLTMNRPDFLRDRALELFSRFSGSTFYIDLPGPDARVAIVKKHLESWLANQSEPAPDIDEILPPDGYKRIARETEGYSGRDLVAALNEAKELGNPWPNNDMIFAGIYSVKSSISKPEELEAIRASVSFARRLGVAADATSAISEYSVEKAVVKRRAPTARSN